MYHSILKTLWDVKEPENSVSGGVSLLSLHETVFSIGGVLSTKYAQEYNLLESSHCITIVTELKRSLHVLFFGDKQWFAKNRYHLRLYGEYCKDYRGGDYSANSSDAAETYLRFAIDNYEKKRGDKQIEVTVFQLVCKCYIPMLQRIALWQGYNEYSQNLLKQGRVYILYRELMLNKSNAEKNEIVDYAATSRNRTKRLHPEEIQKAADAIYGMKLSDNPKITMRASVEHFLIMGNGRRGEDIRNIKLSQLQVSTLPHVGPQPCCVIGASLRDVKERVVNMETLIGWVRFRERMHCPVGALAAYLVWLIDIQGVPILQTMLEDIRTLDTNGSANYKPKWREMHLVFGADIYTPVSTTTHNTDITKLLNAGDIAGKKAKTHLGRNTVLCNETESGVNHSDVRGHMGLEHTTATDVYLRGSYWTRPMLAAAGWTDLNKFNCWWESTEGCIPCVIKDMVFRELDDLQQYAEQVNRRCGGDYSAVEFCKVLVYLRRVFLEDAVVKRERLTGFPPYSHPVFNAQIWNQYEEEERQRTDERMQAWNSKDADVNIRLDQLKEIQEAGARRQEQALNDLIATFGKRVDISAPKETLFVAQLPTFPDKILDMTTFYTGWIEHDSQLLQSHLDQNGGRIAWTKVWAKAEGKTQAIRYQRYQDWLNYLDNMESQTAQAALNVMVGFAKRESITHNVLVKQVFYYAVREDDASCNSEIRAIGYKLLEILEGCNLPRPNTKKLQKKTHAAGA